MMALTVMYQHSIDMQQILEDAARATSLTSARVAASRHSAATVNVPLLVSDILGLLSRCLPGFQATVVAAKLSTTLGTIGESKVITQRTLKSFLSCLSPAYVALYKVVKKLIVLMPDWRRRPAVLRAGLRVAAAGSLAHNTMLSMLLSTEHKIKMPHTNSAPSLLPATVLRLAETEEELIDMSIHVAQLWSLVLAQDGVSEPPTGPFRVNDKFIIRLTINRVAVLPSPSLPQLAPLALDLVLGMENTLQVSGRIIY
ncbi:hypothetical protein V8C86DRAFT_176442 [Haematococcus lacustris]